MGCLKASVARSSCTIFKGLNAKTWSFVSTRRVLPRPSVINFVKVSVNTVLIIFQQQHQLKCTGEGLLHLRMSYIFCIRLNEIFHCVLSLRIKNLEHTDIIKESQGVGNGRPRTHNLPPVHVATSIEYQNFRSR